MGTALNSLSDILDDSDVFLGSPLIPACQEIIGFLWLQIDFFEFFFNMNNQSAVVIELLLYEDLCHMIMNENIIISFDLI